MLVHVVTPPATEPVTLAEAKDHLRLETSDDDAYVTTCIQAARQYAEEVCWRGFVTQTREAVLDGFPSGCEVELPGGNLGAIASVSYADAAGVLQTMDAGRYEADTISTPGRLLLAYGQSWPSARHQWDAVRIRYTVGWEVADVPAPIKQALLLLASHFYEIRTPEVIGAPVGKVAFAVDALLAPYRLVSL